MRILYLLFVSLFLCSPVLAVTGPCETSLPQEGERDDIVIIINDNATDSCEVGLYYAQHRGLGQNNFLHINVPASYFISWSDFKIMRDQIIHQLQQRIAARDTQFTPVVCTGTDSDYYCQASMDQLCQNTLVRYLLTTKGVPTRVRVADSSLSSGTAPASVDNYLKYWLINYFSSDESFSLLSQNRANAFGHGGSMRNVDPALDRELIVGRLDGVTLSSTLAMIDRIMDAEANGIYGKIYSVTNYGSKNNPTGMRLKDYSNNSTNIYDGDDDPWRYQFGIFGETTAECSDYLDSDHYLNYSSSNSLGKSPQDCTLKLSIGTNGANDPPPGRQASRHPLVDDAIWYFGHLDGQPTTGSFSDFLNWRKDTTCTNTLCEDLPEAEQAACRLASIDVYQEIDTRCVGVADGFMGFNYQSFPVALLQISPTGWSTGVSEVYEAGRPKVHDDDGASDSYSLWYENNEEIDSPVCYDSSDFSDAPATACPGQHVINFSQTITFDTVQTSDASSPDQFRVGFKVKAKGLNRSVNVQAFLTVYEYSTGEDVSYSNVTALTVPADTDTGWLDAEALLTIDHEDDSHSDDWDGTYKKIILNIKGSQSASGAIGLDSFTLEKETNNETSAVTLVNPEFNQGHKQVSTGDHAANFLSRLNAVAFWGSLSHHESGGHSFSKHQLETMVYFIRGLPLGDAVWFAEQHNSGILYGDPVYSPVTVHLENLGSDLVNFLSNTQDLALTGSTVNGRDASLVTTTYQVDYCPGDDFYTCDQADAWISPGINGTGGQEDMDLGTLATGAMTAGDYVLRLGVTSSNTGKNRSQTFYDFQQIILYSNSSDYDNDGLSDVVEVEGDTGTDPKVSDTDEDGLSDGEEVNEYGTSPTLGDTDGDGYSDFVEVNKETDPLDSTSYPYEVPIIDEVPCMTPLGILILALIITGSVLHSIKRS